MRVRIIKITFCEGNNMTKYKKLTDYIDFNKNKLLRDIIITICILSFSGSTARFYWNETIKIRKKELNKIGV